MRVNSNLPIGVLVGTHEVIRYVVMADVISCQCVYLKISFDGLPFGDTHILQITSKNLHTNLEIIGSRPNTWSTIEWLRRGNNNVPINDNTSRLAG
jgi:hypothetical protein